MVVSFYGISTLFGSFKFLTIQFSIGMQCKLFLLLLPPRSAPAVSSTRARALGLRARRGALLLLVASFRRVYIRSSPRRSGIGPSLQRHPFSGQRDELISDVLLRTPTHGRAKAGRPARTYIQQLCEDTGCCPEDLPRLMNDREKWREKVRDIRATNTTWWWWWCSVNIKTDLF